MCFILFYFPLGLYAERLPEYPPAAFALTLIFTSVCCYMSCRYMQAPVWASAVFGTGLGYALSTQVVPPVPSNHEMQAEHAKDP